MKERIAEASPRFKARIAGLFYLLTFLTGGIFSFAGGRLVVSGDAAGYSEQHPGAPAISVGFRRRPQRGRVLYRGYGSLL